MPNIKIFKFYNSGHTPLRASSGTWKGEGGVRRPFAPIVFVVWYFFLRAISLGIVVVPSFQIVINLPRTYDNLAVRKILWYRQTKIM